MSLVLATVYSHDMPPSFLLGAWVLALLAVVSMGELAATHLSLPVPAIPVSMVFKRPRGRPRKFDAPSRAVTLTLPEAAIEALSDLHDDLSRAIVRLVQEQTAQRATSPARAIPDAELITFGGEAVIAVRPVKALEASAGVQLLPLPGGQALMTLEAGRTIAEFELALRDALESARLTPGDRKVIAAVLGILKDARHSRDITVRPKNIVVLKSASRRARRR